MVPSQFHALARQITALQSTVFGATEHETSDHTPNLQLGTVKFRAAFSVLSTADTPRMHGVSQRVTAIAHIPVSLGLTVDTTSLFTHLPTGDIYEVAQIGPYMTIFGHQRIPLRRRET